jgi:hypothetical protein
MFEKLKIKYFGRQPAAKISDKTLERIILREFGDKSDEVERKLTLIVSDSSKGKNRLSAAVLKLANKELAKIDLLVELCNIDFRDIVSQAEYPAFFRFGFEELDPRESRRLYLKDWIEYSDWIKGNK